MFVVSGNSVGPTCHLDNGSIHYIRHKTAVTSIIARQVSLPQITSVADSSIPGWSLWNTHYKLS